MSTTVHKATVTLGDERVVEITLWPSAGDSMSEFSGRDAIELSISTCTPDKAIRSPMQSFMFDVQDAVAISNAMDVVLDVALSR